MEKIGEYEPCASHVELDMIFSSNIEPTYNKMIFKNINNYEMSLKKGGDPHRSVITVYY